MGIVEFFTPKCSENQVDEEGRNEWIHARDEVLSVLVESSMDLINSRWAYKSYATRIPAMVSLGTISFASRFPLEGEPETISVRKLLNDHDGNILGVGLFY